MGYLDIKNIESACNTDCTSYCEGTCPFTIDEQGKCPRVRKYCLDDCYDVKK